MTIVADKSDIAVVSKMQRMLEKATTVDEIRHVENLAQRAREYAKAPGLGRDAVNRAGRLALDARRKTGATLKAMRDRGELAERGRKQISQRAIFTLDDLDLTLSDSSRYQLEASVPQKQYDDWVRRVIESHDGTLTASGLRALARKLAGSGEPDGTFLLFPEAAKRIRRLVASLWKRMSRDGRGCLPVLLKSLSSHYHSRANGDVVECPSSPVGPVCRTGQVAPDMADSPEPSAKRPRKHCPTDKRAPRAEAKSNNK